MNQKEKRRKLKENNAMSPELLYLESEKRILSSRALDHIDYIREFDQIFKYDVFAERVSMILVLKETLKELNIIKNIKNVILERDFYKWNMENCNKEKNE